MTEVEDDKAPDIGLGEQELRRVRASLKRAELDDIIYEISLAAEDIEQFQIRSFERGLTRAMDAREIARVDAMRAGARLLEFLKHADKADSRKLLERGKASMQRQGLLNSEASA